MRSKVSEDKGHFRLRRPLRAEHCHPSPRYADFTNHRQQMQEQAQKCATLPFLDVATGTLCCCAIVRRLVCTRHHQRDHFFKHTNGLYVWFTRQLSLLRGWWLFHLARSRIAMFEDDKQRSGLNYCMCCSFPTYLPTVQCQLPNGEHHMPVCFKPATNRDMAFCCSPHILSDRYSATRRLKRRRPQATSWWGRFQNLDGGNGLVWNAACECLYNFETQGTLKLRARSKVRLPVAEFCNRYVQFYYYLSREYNYSNKLSQSWWPVVFWLSFQNLYTSNVYFVSFGTSWSGHLTRLRRPPVVT